MIISVRDPPAPDVIWRDVSPFGTSDGFDEVARTLRLASGGLPVTENMIELADVELGTPEKPGTVPPAVVTTNEVLLVTPDGPVRVTVTVATPAVVVGVTEIE